MSDDKKTGDILGLAPYGEAINTLATGTVEGAGAFLGRICLPAAEEFGLLLRDKVSKWRSENAANILLEAEKQLSRLKDSRKLHAQPRLVARIVEDGSWIADESLQKLWAGLLSTACTEEGSDESNLIFVNLLNQLTSVEVRILAYSCTTATKYLNSGWICAVPLHCDVKTVVDVAGDSDSDRIDRELDHLVSLGLLAQFGGFQAQSITTLPAHITPTGLALQFYARCNGHRGPIGEFYGLVIESDSTS